MSILMPFLDLEEDPSDIAARYSNLSDNEFTPQHIAFAKDIASGVYPEATHEIRQRLRDMLFRPPPKGEEDKYGYVHIIIMQSGILSSIFSIRYPYRSIAPMYARDHKLNSNDYITVHCLWDILPKDFDISDIDKFTQIDLNSV